MFNEAKKLKGVGVGIVIESPRYKRTNLFLKLDFDSSNNQVNYEVLIISLEILLKMGGIYCPHKGSL